MEERMAVASVVKGLASAGTPTMDSIAKKCLEILKRHAPGTITATKLLEFAKQEYNRIEVTKGIFKESHDRDGDNRLKASRARVSYILTDSVKGSSSNAVTFNKEKRPRETREASRSQTTKRPRKYQYDKEVYFHYLNLKEEIPYKLKCLAHNKEFFTKDSRATCKFDLGGTASASSPRAVHKSNRSEYKGKKPYNEYKDKGDKKRSHYERPSKSNKPSSSNVDGENLTAVNQPAWTNEPKGPRVMWQSLAEGEEPSVSYQRRL